MRINFNASFRDVQKLINSPLSEKTGGVGPKIFEETISKALLRDGKHTLIQELTERSASLAPQLTEKSSPMASFNFQDPELLPPDILRSEIAQNEALTDKDEAPGVKTPTLLKLNRISEFEKKSLGERQEIVKELVEAAGQKYGVDPALGMAVVGAESNFNPTAISSDGHASKGLFQLLDRTGKDLLARIAPDRSYDPFDVDLNVELGVGYLRYLHELFSRPTKLPNNVTTTPAANSASLEKLALAAFNAGEGRVSSAQSQAEKAGLDSSIYENIENYLPETTRQYVNRVGGFKDTFEARFKG